MHVQNMNLMSSWIAGHIKEQKTISGESDHRSVAAIL